MASSPGLAPQGTPWPALQDWLLRGPRGQLSRTGFSGDSMASSPGLAPQGTPWPAPPGLAPQGTPWPALQDWLLRGPRGQLLQGWPPPVHRLHGQLLEGWLLRGRHGHLLQGWTPSVHEMWHGGPQCNVKCVWINVCNDLVLLFTVNIHRFK